MKSCLAFPKADHTNLAGESFRRPEDASALSAGMHKNSSVIPREQLFLKNSQPTDFLVNSLIVYAALSDTENVES